MVKKLANSCILTLVVFFAGQSDIVDINKIFQDLSVLVHDQGEIVGELPEYSFSHSAKVRLQTNFIKFLRDLVG